MRLVVAFGVGLIAGCAALAQPVSLGGLGPDAFPVQLSVASLAAITPDGTQGVRLVIDDDDCVAGGAAGVVLCIDTGAAWEPVGAGAGTDDQAAVEVPYTPTVPTDWVDPDPAEVEAGLDDLAARLTAKEAETFAGDVTGPPSATVVGDDSHAHTTTTISGLDTGDVTTGTWANARVAQSNVTQHEGALSITESQVSDLAHFAPATGISTDHGAGAVSATTDLAATLCGTGEILEDQGAAWACIATPAGGGGTPGGLDSQIQYNNGGAFGGDADLVWDDTGKMLTLGSTTSTTQVVLPLANDQVTPTLGFGDGDTGMYEAVDDDLYLVTPVTGRLRLSDDFGNPRVQLMAHGTNAGAVLRFAVPDATTPNIHVREDYNTGVGGVTDDLRLIAGGVSSLGITDTMVTAYVSRADEPSSVTCADSGDANPGTLIVNPGRSLIQVTNSDADGCSVTLSETAATNGELVEFILVSSVGGTLNINDAAGIQEMGTGCSLPLWGTAALRYSVDRWTRRICETDV